MGPGAEAGTTWVDCSDFNIQTTTLLRDTPSRPRDTLRPSFANSFAPKKRGRREDRVRAAPAVSRANAQSKKRTRAYRFSGSSPAFPAQWFTAYFVLSPVRPGLFVTVVPKKRELLKNLTPANGASGPHDFAVRLSRARQSQPSRPSLPDPRFVTNAHTPLWWDGMAQEVKLICLRDQAQPLRHIGTTGKSVNMLSRFIRWSDALFRLASSMRKSEAEIRVMVGA
jgi:hypothetical protein